MKDGALFEKASSATAGIIEIGNRKQLFLDDLLVDEASRISRFMYRPDKYPGNPILTAEEPWEMGKNRRGIVAGVEITGQTVIYDEQEGIFKMWYLGWMWEDGLRPWCYATSKNGYDWERPDLGIYEYESSKRNNIMFAATDPNYFNVFKDPRDPDPKRLYKAQGEVEGPISNTTGGAINAYSPDGIHWTEHPDNPVVNHGANFADASTVLGWDPKREKYVGYFRPGHPVAHEIDGIGRHRHIRTIGYSESDDFENWTPTRIMLAPDHLSRADHQFMQFTAGIYGDFYVGFLMLHQTHEQTWETFLLSSRDGFNWTWVDRHVPFLSYGELGSYDAGYMTPSGPILHDGTIWVYYGAFRGAHGYDPVKRGRAAGDQTNMTIALATLNEDRWAGLLAGPNQALLVTKPLIFKGTRLKLDIHASVPHGKPGGIPNFDECDVRAAISDQSGMLIDGFSFDRSTNIRESGIHEISWEGMDLRRLEGETVRLRLEMRNCCLCSFQFY